MDKGNTIEHIMAGSNGQDINYTATNNGQDTVIIELRHKLDLLLRTGRILVESAADTARILRTMKRAAAFLGLDERYLHLYVNWNVLMVNYSDEEHSFTKFQRCEKHGINLTAISMVSKLTWRAIKEDYTLEQYEEACTTYVPASATSRLGRWPQAEALPAAASAYSSAATGRRSSTAH